jgi:hypothetical protein
MGPVAAPEGTVAVKLVDELLVIVAATPLKKTLLPRDIGSKTPVSITASPTLAEVGLNDVIIGAAL